MSKKRKILLFFTVCIIIVSYFIAFKSIFNKDTHQLRNREKTQLNYTEKTGYQAFDNIANEVERSLANESDNNENYESQYMGNQLSNGSSPFDTCFGKGMYRGNAKLTIKNGANSDAIVSLYSVSLDKTIRNEYVQKNTSFTMDNIENGNYQIRVLFGNDWNPELENPCGGYGYFESDVSLSEFDNTEYFEDNDDGYTIATITLYTVDGGNVSTSIINTNDFFDN